MNLMDYINTFNLGIDITQTTWTIVVVTCTERADRSPVLDLLAPAQGITTLNLPFIPQTGGEHPTRLHWNITGKYYAVDDIEFSKPLKFNK